MLAMWKLPDDSRSLMLVLLCQKIDYAKGALRVALRAVAKPGLAIEL